MSSLRICRMLIVTAFATLPLGSAARDAAGETDSNPPAAHSTPPDFTADQLEFFEKHVRPVFAEHCYSCHSVNAERLEAGLFMDSRAALVRGGDSGEAIVPGDAEASMLVEAVRYEGYEMPPSGKLSDQEIGAIERWIAMGAPWPAEAAPSGAAAVEAFDLDHRRDNHWAWQPLKSPDAPEVADAQWPLSASDAFLLAKLEAAGLRPSRDVDRAALMRRLYFDLVGLPPTPAQAATFLADTSDDATAKLVDELLASPHFGERWGRHWLDLVRYAESRGHEFDNDTPNAFQYRDYIIRAFNADIPYDQLVREHIAGDLLPEPRLHPESGTNESILGTGFWFLGEWVHSPVDIRKDEADRFDNMIDVMSKSFLGMTVACARCHDHKFDAISTADYYSLTGFLQSSDYRQVRFESIEQNGRVAGELAELDAGYQRMVSEVLKGEGVSLPDQPDALEHDSIVVDYGDVAPDDYLQDGFVFGRGPQRAGLAFADFNDPSEFRIARQTAAVSDPLWNGLKSITKGGVSDRSVLAKLPKSGRTLRTPTFELDGQTVSCLVHGTGHVIACVDSHRLVAGPLHKQTIKPIKADKKGWVTLNLKRYAGHRLHLEFVPAKNARLSVQLVVQGLGGPELQDLQARHAARYQPFEAYADAAEALFEPDVTSGGRTTAVAEKVGRIFEAWQRKRSELGSQVVRKSHLALAMMDGSGEDGRILIRGNASKPGDVEPRHFLTSLTGDQPMPIVRGSGRLELAEKINDPSNPLTSRVIVNRIWHHLLGRGIVPTTDDFGVLGQRPSHPELLDHLATEFLREGRSIKRMIRKIVLSRAYQMSTHPDPAAMDADPKNSLWHHRPPKRLEGEAIRDALLSISGRLDPTRFGPPVPIHLTEFMDGRGRPKRSGPLDGDGRRSIYIALRRNFLSPFMVTFDSPTPFSTMGRRNVSNVPAQALILMNDPVVVDLAGSWARRAVRAYGDVDARVVWMYQTAFARQPHPQELAIAVRYLDSRIAASGGDADADAPWGDFAHALINTKEFIFLR